MKNSNNKKQEKEKFFYDKGKMSYLWPSALWTYWRANHIVKKNKKEYDAFPEEYRYKWLDKRVKKAMTFFDVDIQVQGIENWLDRGVVLMPNHESNFDVIALLAINDFEKQQPMAFIAKKDLWLNKKTSRFVNLIDAIPMDQNNPRSAIEAFREAKDLIVDFKRSLVLFPSGTRSYSNEVGEFLPGAFKLPQMANAPIVPVSFIDSYKVFAPERKGRVTVKVVFGKPIMPSRSLGLSTQDLAALVKKDIENNIEEYKDKELTPLKELQMSEKQKAKQEEKKKKKDKKTSFFKIVD